MSAYTQAQLEALLRLVESPGWAILTQHLSDMIDKDHKDLELADFENLRTLGKVQGRIWAFRHVLGWTPARAKELKGE